MTGTTLLSHDNRCAKRMGPFSFATKMFAVMHIADMLSLSSAQSCQKTTVALTDGAPTGLCGYVMKDIHHI